MRCDQHTHKKCKNVNAFIGRKGGRKEVEELNIYLKKFFLKNDNKKVEDRLRNSFSGM